MEEKKQTFSNSWFFKRFINNQTVTFFLVTLLIVLTLFVLTKISFLFSPIRSFLEIILLPMLLTGLLYYLMNPIVDLLERYKVPRTVAISFLFIVIAFLLVWGLAVAIPNIQRQVVSLARNLPSYIQETELQITAILQDDRFEQLRPTVLEMLDNVNSHIISFAQKLSSSAMDWAKELISATSHVVMAVLIMPFILFYLLRDGHHLKGHITKYLPIKWRSSIGDVLTDVNNQLSNYVRGQVTVAMIVALMFSVMFSIIGLSYPIALGIMAGFLNLIPFLGSFLAMIPALILGVIAGPFMLFKVVVVFAVEQTIEGRFVTPLIIGSSLNIHPITILFVLLTTGQMFGVVGVLIGIPIYASIKVVLRAIFRWYKGYSGLYELAEEVDEDVHDKQ